MMAMYAWAAPSSNKPNTDERNFMSDSLSPEIIRLLLVLVATIAAHFIVRRILQHAEKITSRSNNIWDDSLVRAALKPVPVLVWLTGVSFELHLIHRQTGEQLLEYISPARNIGVVLCIAWFLLKLIRELAEKIVVARTQADEEIDRTTVDGLSKVSRIIVIVVAALTIMQTLGFSLSGVLAFGGMGGVAVGFASKDLLANFFGGLMIHLDRPFNVGETIRSPDKQIEGKVEYIGWRQTRIRATNMALIYVPNALFTSIVIENPSRMSHRRIRETIGLRYDDLAKMNVIVDEVRSLLKNHPDIDQTTDGEQAIVVAFNEFADSSVNLMLQALCKTTNLAQFHAVKQEILLAVSGIIAKHGAEMAFPTRTLLLHQTPA
jgi:MscS family membrane protein